MKVIFVDMQDTKLSPRQVCAKFVRNNYSRKWNQTQRSSSAAATHGTAVRTFSLATMCCLQYSKVGVPFQRNTLAKILWRFYICVIVLLQLGRVTLSCFLWVVLAVLVTCSAVVTCTCSGKHTRKTQCLIFIRRCEGCDILLLLKLNFSIFQGKMFGLVGISIFWRKRCYVHSPRDDCVIGNWNR